MNIKLRSGDVWNKDGIDFKMLHDTFDEFLSRCIRKKHIKIFPNNDWRNPINEESEMIVKIKTMRNGLNVNIEFEILQ